MQTAVQMRSGLGHVAASHQGEHQHVAQPFKPVAELFPEQVAEIGFEAAVDLNGQSSAV